MKVAAAPTSLFRNLGTVELPDDVETVVTISNQNADGFVILDALQLTDEIR